MILPSVCFKKSTLTKFKLSFLKVKILLFCPGLLLLLFKKKFSVNIIINNTLINLKSHKDKHDKNEINISIDKNI
ncbi:hypothetical protein MHSN_00195 [Metamycoplasma hyosynoviae]|uniref:Uncharacterized protein n=1 Tax=Metamycoplasma hyosynoviae TaxID=29559 RepID=A0A4P1QFP3_9BACT|nr:hypothetical protein MHSN_00195 [Metamycoplasma hyosynoviae]